MPRFPISFKLIAAAVTLVAGLTVGFVWMGHQLLTKVYHEQAERLHRERIAELERRSVAVASHVGDTASEALAGSETARLHRVLLVIAAGDPEIRTAAIADESGRILVRSDQELSATLASETHFNDVNPGGPVVAERTLDGNRLREVTYPVQTPAGRMLGYLRIAWSLRQLEIDLDGIERKRDRDVARATTAMVVAGGLAVLVGILAGIIGGMGLARPIRRLAQTARDIAGGRLSTRAEVSSRDEIGDLASTMNDMASQLGQLMEETRQNAELEQELAVARQIQRALLPAVTVVRCPGLHVCGTVEPASHCGGDWWTYLKLTRQRTLVLVGDVTGHGISSAMLTATARSCLDTVRQLTRGDFQVGYLLKIMDQLLREGIGDEYHMTCFASILDPIEGTLTYANAGHNQPYLLRYTPEGWRHGRLSARGNRLGDADGHAFVEHTIKTRPRDLLCWHSDGLVEAVDGDGREFGGRRLRQVLSGATDETPDVVLERVMAGLHEHQAGQPLSDDVTCVIGRVVA